MSAVRRRVAPLSAAFALWASACSAPAQTAPQQPAAEIETRDSPLLFRERVNLVVVPVVVRDNRGRAIGGLRKQDFQLFDQGKAQEITRFSAEASAGRRGSGTPGAAAAPAAPAPPERFVAYLFDDVHVNAGDLSRVREAARSHLAALSPEQRAAVYTTSGQVTQEFTADRGELEKALTRVLPHPIARPDDAAPGCVNIPHYLADLIVNYADHDATMAAALEAARCLKGDAPNAMVVNFARQALNGHEHETRVALGTLEGVVRRMATMPGARTIVLVSPGFLAREQQALMDAILQRAVRAQVIVNCLDSRGLYTAPGFDASDAFAAGIEPRYRIAAARAASDVMADLASGTGGTLFENSNDMAAGFSRLAGAPESYYVLGFSPQNLKADGRFHALKASVKGISGATVSARRGYYAPTRHADAAETARIELQEALFSREEMHELPVSLQTQFFKSGGGATLSLIARLGVKGLGFRKTGDRNCNTVTIVAGLFDRDGNFVSAIAKTVEFRLRDETLAQLEPTGVTIRTNFQAQPGAYAVRLVVRDTERQQMSAENGAIEIPY
jgi:VWFA-related protein